MSISRVLTVAPATEPVTLDEVKAHLRLDTDEDDALLGVMATAARQLVEQITGRALITQTWLTTLDAWPERGVDMLPLPLAAVSGISVYAADGVTTEIDAASYYTTGGSLPRVIAPFGISPGRAVGGIAITHTAGYGATGDSVPAALKLAILQITAAMYERRGDDVGDDQTDTISRIPAGARALINPYRILRI